MLESKLDWVSASIVAPGGESGVATLACPPRQREAGAVLSESIPATEIRSDAPRGPGRGPRL